jgi:hypothetical protein
LLEEGERPYALGNPTPLVLTGLRSPSRYIYLSAGVDRWISDHTPGGIKGWQAEIAADDPPMIILGGPWRGEIAREMRSWVRANYRRVKKAGLIMFLSPRTYERAERRRLVGRRDR